MFLGWGCFAKPGQQIKLRRKHIKCQDPRVETLKYVHRLPVVVIANGAHFGNRPPKRTNREWHFTKRSSEETAAG